MTRNESDAHVSDPDQGIWGGRAIARRFVSPEGFVVLVGRSASDNDLLTFKLASPRDFWLHVAGDSGSHVVVRNPENVSKLPRETARYAAALAAGYSKASSGGQVAVHMVRRSEVRKPRGMPAGKVTIGKYVSLKVSPSKGED